LLEEERRPGSEALLMDFIDPRFANGAGGAAALAADNRPMNAGEIECSYRPDQWLE
jgi:hypothetical protein